MNWKILISEMQAAGLSQTQIGERLRKSQAWVSAVSCGKYDDLKWADGQALLALHGESCNPRKPVDRRKQGVV